MNRDIQTIFSPSGVPQVNKLRGKATFCHEKNSSEMLRWSKAI